MIKSADVNVGIKPTTDKKMMCEGFFKSLRKGIFWKSVWVVQQVLYSADNNNTC
jgi:hypothetical protein